MNENLKDTIIGGAGMGVIEAAGHVEQITQGGGLLVQIVIGIVTLIKLLKRKKVKNDNN